MMGYVAKHLELSMECNMFQMNSMKLLNGSIPNKQ